ncbi:MULTISPECIES: hypothetical protein [Streptomyces]|uniref:DUF320 domain-containing protein n=1 Tax=Streptomyces luteosporeus TaxID=173856 RepID=A0ABN3TTW5_9ACTN
MRSGSRLLFSAVISAVVLVGGVATQAYAAPSDTDLKTCIDGGGLPDVKVGGGVLSFTVTKVCKGGTQDGQTIS